MMDKSRYEEVLNEYPFLPGNEKWGGKVQVLRITYRQPDGMERVFISKRLILNSSQRYMNLPRAGIEELIEAILSATEDEKVHHEALLAEINQRRPEQRRPEVIRRWTQEQPRYAQARGGRR